jgi:hypothetical protein
MTDDEARLEALFARVPEAKLCFDVGQAFLGIVKLTFLAAPKMQVH